MRINIFFVHLLISSVTSFRSTQDRAASCTAAKGSLPPPRLLPTQPPSTTTALSSTSEDTNNNGDEISINVLGTRMECCCSNVRNTGVGTGFYRNGYCSTGAQDIGRHTVCVRVTDDFLEYSKSVGNDLSTPYPEYLFPGLKGGDIWCLCAQRWAQAYQAGKAPKLYLRATHEKTLDYVGFEVLRQYALDGAEADAAKGALDAKRDELEKLFGGRSREAEDSS